jgi:DNA-directed RNA polymerase subunit F
MSIFDRINKRLSDNLYRHGHYLTNPHAKDPEKIAEMVDDLMEFVKEEARADVRAKVISLIRRHRHRDVEIDANSSESRET